MTRTNKQKSAPKTRSNQRSAGKPKNNPNDFQLSVGAANTRIVRTQKPVITSSVSKDGDARIRVKHREYIADVSGSVSFTDTQYPINPGMVKTFPWLASIAANYESYKFHDLRFEFETQKSTATNGSLMLGVDFDAADSAPADKVDLMSMHNAVRSAVWAECEYSASRQDLAKFGVQRYVRQANLGSNLDIKTYDVGTLNVATQGCADTTAIGELYVSYDVEFMTPQRSNNVAVSTQITGVSGTTGSSWLGTTPTSYGGGAWTGTANTITCVIPGDYEIVANFVTATSVSKAAITGTATATERMTSQDAVANLIHVITVNNATAGQTVIFNDTGAGAWSSSKIFIAPFSYESLN